MNFVALVKILCWAETMLAGVVLILGQGEIERDSNDTDRETVIRDRGRDRGRGRGRGRDRGGGRGG